MRYELECYCQIIVPGDPSQKNKLVRHPYCTADHTSSLPTMIINTSSFPTTDAIERLADEIFSDPNLCSDTIH